MPCLDSAREVERGGGGEKGAKRKEERGEGEGGGGRGEIYDKATLILIHGTVSILELVPRSRLGRDRAAEEEGKKGIYPPTASSFLESSSFRGGDFLFFSPPRRRRRRREVEDESREGGGGGRGVRRCWERRSRAVYLAALDGPLSRSILIDARLERRLFQSGLSGAPR